jgi:hypothetical protein
VVQRDSPHQVQLIAASGDVASFSEALTEETQLVRRNIRRSLRRPTNNAELDAAAPLFQDFEFYHRACSSQNRNRVESIQEAVNNSMRGPRNYRPYDGQSPEDFHQRGQSQGR